MGPESRWEADWVGQAVTKIGRLTSDKAWVRVVFAADPELVWALVRDAGVLDGLRGLGVRLISLEPWQDPAVRQWLEDCQFGPVDKTGREELRRVTGNWPWLLAEFHRRCQAGGAWEEHLGRLAADLAKKEGWVALARVFGGEEAGRAEALRELAAYGELSEEDLAGLVGDPVRVGAVLRWAELLRLADLGEVSWRLDPVVAGLWGGTGG